MVKRPQLPGIGGRVWKTGLAVAISLAICKAMKIPDPVFAGVAAVICVQPTVLQSFKKGTQRLQATIIGALVGLAMIYAIGSSPAPYVRPIAAGAAVIVALWVCVALRWQDAVVLAATTVVVMMMHGEMGTNLPAYAVERTVVTAIGVIVASLVNALMIWPKVEDRFPKRLPQIAPQAFEEFEEAVKIFRTRDLAGARAAMERWNACRKDYDAAASEIAWFRESAAVRQYLPLHQMDVAPTLSEIYYMIDTLHQASGSIIRDTIRILEDHPNYVIEDAHVYEIMGQTLGIFTDLRQAIVASIRDGRAQGLEEADKNWDSELHSRFIASIRAAHRSPRDIFPLFEVAKVAMELRNYSRTLVRIRQLLIENSHILPIFGKYR